MSSATLLSFYYGESGILLPKSTRPANNSIETITLSGRGFSRSYQVQWCNINNLYVCKIGIQFLRSTNATNRYQGYLINNFKWAIGVQWGWIITATSRSEAVSQYQDLLTTHGYEFIPYTFVNFDHIKPDGSTFAFNEGYMTYIYVVFPYLPFFNAENHQWIILTMHKINYNTFSNKYSPLGDVTAINYNTPATYITYRASGQGGPILVEYTSGTSGSISGTTRYTFTGTLTPAGTPTLGSADTLLVDVSPANITLADTKLSNADGDLIIGEGYFTVTIGG